MAQPIQFLSIFQGAMSIKAGTTYATADIITAYPTATTLILKTRGTISKPIRVSVNGTIAFEVDYNEHTNIETGHTYVFNRDCEVAVVKYVTGGV